ncbi:hypothetical protein CN918_28075 [Priestia megaterium]|nr:hypothetical protein CN918_28075 [Priestia megaterium]
MAKRYMLQMTEGEYYLFECRGMKRKENKLQLIAREQFIYEILYEQFLERLCDLVIEKLTYQDIRREHRKITVMVRQCLEKEIGGIQSYLLIKETSLNLYKMQKILARYHKKSNKGTYHLFNEEGNFLIRKGDMLKDQSIIPASFPGYQSRVEEVQKRFDKWKEKMLLHFSEWELLDVLWIATLFQESKNKQYPLWIKDRYGDRADYIHIYNDERMEDILYLNIVLNKQ